MNKVLHTISTALLVPASLGLAACQSEAPTAEEQSAAEGMPCPSGELSVIASDQATFGGGLVADGHYTYWFVGGAPDPTGSLMRTPESGGPPEVLVHGLQGMPVLDDHTINWVQEDYDSLNHVLTSESLFSVPKAGGTPTLIAQTTTGFGTLVAADAGHFYFVGREPDNASVRSMPRTGGVETVIFQGPQQPLTEVGILEMLVDEHNLYWSLGDTVMALPKTGGAPVVLSTGTHAVGFVQDAGHLYWLAAGGDLFSVPKTGGATTTLASGLATRGDLATDGTCLYLSTQDSTLLGMHNGGGAISSLATIPVASDTGIITGADGSGFYLADTNGLVFRLAR